MQFAAVSWLLALVLVPALWLAIKAADRRADRRARLLLGGQAIRLREDWQPRARGWRRFGYLTGLAWLILALARPQWGASEVSVTQRGYDVVIALDISRSMLAQDVTPSRLERAKSELTSFLRRQVDGRVGLVLFAGAAFVQCPLTTDLATAEIFLQMAAPDMISAQGTALASALRVSREVLQSGRGAHEAGSFQAVLLVTDGEDLEGDWEQEAQACRRDGITVIPVGVGEESGGLVPLADEQGRPAGFLRDADGGLVLSRLDLASLDRLAAIAGGSTFRVGLDGLAGERLRAVLERLGKRDFEQRQVTRWQERYHWPLALALASFMLAVAMQPRRARSARRRGGAPTLAAPGALLLGAALGLWATPGAAAAMLRPEWAGAMARGQAAYSAGDFEAALRQFEQARLQAPAEPRLALAVGAALYRLGRYTEAAAEFARARDLSPRPELAAESLFNAGTTALAQGDAQAAADQLRRSLELEPARRDALHNLETALLLLQQQQQQQQGQDPPPDQQHDQSETEEQGQGQEQSQDQDQRHDQDRESGGQDSEQPPPARDRPEPQDRSSPEDGDDQHGQEPETGSPPASPPAEPAAEPAVEAGADEPEMDLEQALRLLQALDRDELELKRSVQQRLRGPGAQSGREW